MRDGTSQIALQEIARLYLRATTLAFLASLAFLA